MTQTRAPYATSEPMVAALLEAEQLILAAVNLMTPEQVGQWRGVRYWQEVTLDEVLTVVSAVIPTVTKCPRCGVYLERNPLLPLPQVIVCLTCQDTVILTADDGRLTAVREPPAVIKDWEDS